jgi:N utilization substance protein B
VDIKTIRSKKRARKLALQALYQWLMSEEAVGEIEAQFRSMNNMQKVDEAYFCLLLQGVISHKKELEARFSPYLDRALSVLNPIELVLLWMGAFELLYCLEVPYRVVLDESISLAKAFGSQDGHKYVNGILHQLAKEVRKVEQGLVP